ncbi:hypothetical protein [Undibacterium sp. Ren11W]|uniref:hypothetical protein n=1 Tax=Undibacterium sp. Ren11W TaxID=3413045 RepID=UPI003BF31D34
MNKTMIAAISAAFFLSACGGGSSTPSTPSIMQPAPTTVTGVITPTVTAVPPSNVGAVSINSKVISISNGGGKYLLTPVSGAVLSLSGDSNTLQISAGAILGTVAISGNENNIILLGALTVTTLTVTGQKNTIWIPEGATVNVANSMLVSNVVKHYKP